MQGLTLTRIYEPLNEAHRALIVAPVLATVGMAFVTISHSVPIAVSYELVPDYIAATGPAKEAIASSFDLWAVSCLIFNYIGDVPVWGVGFLGFFVWITAMGVSLLRSSRTERDAPVPVLQ